MRRVLEVMAQSAGGIARHVAQVTAALDGQAGLTVDVAAPPGMPIALPKEVLPVDIPKSPFGHRRAVARLAELIEQGGYDVVHAHGLRAALDAGRAARGRARCLVTFHNLIHPEVSGTLRARLYRPAERAVVRLAARTLAVSEQIAGHLRALEPAAAARIETLYLGIGPAPQPLRGRAEVRAELGDPPLLVVSAARLVPQKAVHVLLEALALLGDDVHAAIAGEGRLRGALERRAAELGLGARVHWLGFRPDVADLIAAADAFCLSSVWEGVPLAAQEAILLGTPVVATAVGGMPELVDDGISGRLVPPGQPGALAAALRAVLYDRAEAAALARAAHARLEKRFSTAAMVARLKELYLEDGGA